ncbi:foxk2 [Ecytonucleospora hepatopenaei]|uniref:Foxk2 n=1 Tax=Ecytonucleospora hepatopenaei TaxID=646526 RepID=A0A1W0E7E7_9MICR|nr:foxk2 [Ecytonucleospora hepatopenaei]
MFLDITDLEGINNTAGNEYNTNMKNNTVKNNPSDKCNNTYNNLYNTNYTNPYNTNYTNLHGNNLNTNPYDYDNNLKKDKNKKTNESTETTPYDYYATYTSNNSYTTTNTEYMSDIFKIPSHDNYMELCQLLMDKEERQEYVSPVLLNNYSITNSNVNNNITNSNITNTNSNLQSNIKYNNINNINKHNIKNTFINDPNKPDDSYAYMILKALSTSPDGMLTLNEIYTWIEENYPYFRTADAIWKNSIRHNLSLNPAFKKTPRQAYQRGKGGYWSLAEDKSLVRKINRKRRVTRSYPGYSMNKQCHYTEEEYNDNIYM